MMRQMGINTSGDIYFTTETNSVSFLTLVCVFPRDAHHLLAVVAQRAEGLVFWPVLVQRSL